MRVVSCLCESVDVGLRGSNTLGTSTLGLKNFYDEKEVDDLS